MNNLEILWDKISSDRVVWSYAIAASVIVAILWQYWQNMYSVPTYGGICSFSRSLSTLRLGSKGREQAMEAYTQHPLMVIPRLETWAVTAHSKYVEEISRAPDDVLSFMDAAAELVQIRYTFGPKFMSDHYHLNVIRNQLTRNLASLFPDVLDETRQALSDYVDTKGDGWTTVNVNSFCQKVVSRASNRIFVGLPLCRNEEWLSIMIDTAVDSIKVSTFINLFPTVLRPIAGWFTSTKDRRLNAAVKVGGKLIEEKLAEHAIEPSNDFLSWLISSAPEHERNPRDITARVLMTNFVAIHTSSMTVTNGLYWLMARQTYYEPLLQEINEVTARLGWSKEAVQGMHKLDSFMKECMRISPIGTQVMSRKVRKLFTFSNGFQAPVGMTISAHLYATHHDESIYPHADEFDGFRFLQPTTATAEATEKGVIPDGEKPAAGHGVKKTMYTTSKTYLAFGHGRHACPGRFFASMEVKLVLAYLIANYEMKWPDAVYDNASIPGNTEEGYHPPDLCFGHRVYPDRRPEMMIRRRVGSGA